MGQLNSTHKPYADSQMLFGVLRIFILLDDQIINMHTKNV